MTFALCLRPVSEADEPEFAAAHRAMLGDDFQFGLGYDAQEPFATYVARLAAHARGLDLEDGCVPGTFLVAVIGATIVGRTSIRHRLNDFLLAEGGHIGYGVLPDFRRRGLATEILRQSLVIARSLGVDRVLVTCDDDNAGSIGVIERCGGELDPAWSRTEGDPPKRRYWFD